MAGKGTYAAYKEAYADKPLDVAGSVAAGFDKSTKDIAKNKEDKRKEKKLDARTEKLDKERADNTKYTRDRNSEQDFYKATSLLDLYTGGNKSGAQTSKNAKKLVTLQGNSPPAAATIATQAGTELAAIHKNFPPGLDRAMKTGNILKQSKQANDAITSSYIALESRRGDSYETDSKLYAPAANLVNGNLTYLWENGVLMVKGTSVDGEDVDMSVTDFNQLIITPDKVALVDQKVGQDAINSARVEQEYNLNSIEGQNAYVKTAMGIAQSQLGEHSPGATIRYMYNSVQFKTEDEKALVLSAGQKIQNGLTLDDLSKEEQAVLTTYLPVAQKTYARSLVGNLPKATHRNGKLIADDTDKVVDLEDKDFVETAAGILGSTYTPDEASSIAESASEGDLSGLTTGIPGAQVVNEGAGSTQLQDKDGYPIVSIKWETDGILLKDRTGAGTFNLGGDVISFDNWNDFKDKFSSAIQGDGASTLKHFESGQYLVEDNLNKVVSNVRAKYEPLHNEKNVTFNLNKSKKMEIEQSGKVVATIDLDGLYPIPDRSKFQSTAEYNTALQNTIDDRQSAIEIELDLL